LNFPTTGLADENFKQLDQLDKRYRDQGLVILGFPTNQFAGQEPIVQEEILAFIRRKYNVDFEIYEKLDVNGSNTNQLFDYLKNILPGTITNDLKWHFTKFLIDRNGNPVKRFAPNDPPFSFEEEIRHLLRQESVLLKGLHNLQEKQLGQGGEMKEESWAKNSIKGSSDWEKNKDWEEGKDWEPKSELQQKHGYETTELPCKPDLDELERKKLFSEIERHDVKLKHTDSEYAREIEQPSTLSNVASTITEAATAMKDKVSDAATSAKNKVSEMMSFDTSLNKEQMDTGLTGEGGKVGAQMGVHLGAHSLQAGFQAGKDPQKTQEQKI